MLMTLGLVRVRARVRVMVKVRVKVRFRVEKYSGFDLSIDVLPAPEIHRMSSVLSTAVLYLSLKIWYVSHINGSE